MKTLIIEPGTRFPDDYADTPVAWFTFTNIPADIALPCPVCLKFADKHTWQATEHGRVIDCSEAVA